MALDAWWGAESLAVGERKHWRIGSLRLALSRGDEELVVSWRESGDALDASMMRASPTATLEGEEPEEADSEQERFVVVGAAEVELVPMVADRPVVARPDVPLTVPVGGQVTAYVSTPVFVALRCGPADWEASSHRLSDTWFGPNTREGELAYASRTLLRLSAGDVLRRPHRTITPVVLVNGGTGPMTVDRIRVPVPRLSLYVGADALWTSAVRLERSGGDQGRVIVVPGPPEEASDAVLLSPPRLHVDDHLVLRVFNLLPRMDR